MTIETRLLQTNHRAIRGETMTAKQTGNQWPFARRTARWMIVLLSCLLGFAAQAEDEDPFAISDEEYPDEAAMERLTRPTSYIEAGATYVSEDSFKFGEYTGLKKEGFYFLGNIDIEQRDPWDSGKTLHWRLRGLNLGLESRYADLLFQNQGKYEVFALFDQTPAYRTDTAQFPFLGLGTSRLTLAPDWGAGGVGSDASADPLAQAINDHLQGFGIKTRRERFAAGFDAVLSPNLNLYFRADRETKKGTKMVGAVIGSSGGNPRASTIPEPIDYVTYEYDANLRYSSEKGQLVLGYYGSTFTSQVDSVSWQNPYDQIGGWVDNSGYDPSGLSGFGQRATPPDNWFHQVKAAGGYSIHEPSRTRLTADAAFGWMQQNEEFLPFTVNPDARDSDGISPVTDTPLDDLNGMIMTTMVNVRLTSQPIKPLRLKLNYRYDDRHNTSDRAIFRYVGGDSSNQRPLDDSHARLNRPYSYTTQDIFGEAAYRIMKDLQLSLGAGWHRQDRDLQEVEHLDTVRMPATLSWRPTSIVNMRLKYEYSNRSGSEYNGIAPEYAGHSPQYNATIDPNSDWENHPALRKSYQADRIGNEVKAMLNVVPTDTVDVGLTFKWADWNYNKTVPQPLTLSYDPPVPGPEDGVFGDGNIVGLSDREILSATLDLGWNPTPVVGTYAYYTWERMTSDWAGWGFRGGGSKLSTANDASRRWFTQDEDTAHTVGAGVKWKAIPDELGFGLDFLWSQTTGRNGYQAISSATPANFPDSNTELYDVAVHMDWEFAENLTFRVGYLFEYFRSNDWQLDGVDPDTLNRVIAAGNESPDYTERVPSLSLIFKFQ